MNHLIEKIKNIVTAYRYSESELIAKKVMTTVLDHFSDPENVTVNMTAALKTWDPMASYAKAGIAAAMKAAKEGLK